MTLSCRYYQSNLDGLGKYHYWLYLSQQPRHQSSASLFLEPID